MDTYVKLTISFSEAIPLKKHMNHFEAIHNSFQKMSLLRIVIHIK